jgi:hypothetical protein
MDEETCKKARIEEEEKLLKVSVKWSNAIFHFEVDPEDDVEILKHLIHRETQVRPDRQKILNLKAKGGK